MKVVVKSTLPLMSEAENTKNVTIQSHLPPFSADPQQQPTTSQMTPFANPATPQPQPGFGGTTGSFGATPQPGFGVGTGLGSTGFAPLSDEIIMANMHLHNSQTLSQLFTLYASQFSAVKHSSFEPIPMQTTTTIPQVLSFERIICPQMGNGPSSLPTIKHLDLPITTSDFASHPLSSASPHFTLPSLSMMTTDQQMSLIQLNVLPENGGKKGKQRAREEDETDLFEEDGEELNPYKKSKLNQFACEWKDCNETYSTKTGLATHCGLHLTQFFKSRKKIQCQWGNCTQSFTNLKMFAKHLAQGNHIGQTPFLPKIDETKISKQSDKKWACSVQGCSKRFSDPSNCKKHEKTHDLNRKRFYCTEPGCKKSYSTKTDLNIHMKMHQGDYPHKCTHQDCGKAFVRLSELYAHERTHDKILPHQCEICGKKFREKARLLKHQSFHHEKG